MKESLDSMLRERNKTRQKDAREGLAFCAYCDGEYTDAQVIVIEDEKSCPHCKKPEYKTYYYQN